MVANAGGLQSQGGKGKAVVSYRKPLTTQDLEFSGVPEGKKRGFKNKLLWNSHQVTSIHRTNSSTTCCHNLNIKIFAIFSMQHWGKGDRTLTNQVGYRFPSSCKFIDLDTLPQNMYCIPVHKIRRKIWPYKQHTPMLGQSWPLY